MTADQAVKTMERLLNHYKEKMPENFAKVEEAIKAFKEYMHDAEGKMARQTVSNQLRCASCLLMAGFLVEGDFANTFIDAWETVSRNLPKGKTRIEAFVDYFKKNPIPKRWEIPELIDSFKRFLTKVKNIGGIEYKPHNKELEQLKKIRFDAARGLVPSYY